MESYPSWTDEDVQLFNLWLREHHQSAVRSYRLTMDGGADMMAVKPPGVNGAFKQWMRERFREFEPIRKESHNANAGP